MSLLIVSCDARGLSGSVRGVLPERGAWRRPWRAVESGSTNQEAEKRRTSENEWTAAAPLLRRGLQLHHRRVATRRLGGLGEGRELLWKQKSSRWKQTQMRAAVLATGAVQSVNPRPTAGSVFLNTMIHST